MGCAQTSGVRRGARRDGGAGRRGGGRALAGLGGLWMVCASVGSGVWGKGGRPADYETRNVDVDTSFLSEPGWRLGGVDKWLWSDRCTIERMEEPDPERFDREFRGRKPVVIREPVTSAALWTEEDLEAFVRYNADVPTTVYHPFEMPTVGGRVTTLIDYFRDWKSVGAGQEEGVQGGEKGEKGVEEELTSWQAAKRNAVLSGGVAEADYVFDKGAFTLRTDLFDAWVPGLNNSAPPVFRKLCGFNRGEYGKYFGPEATASADDVWCSEMRTSLGPSGTGLPFHVHTEVCGNLVIWGRKRWFLSQKAPVFNPKRNVGRWVTEEYAALLRGESVSQSPDAATLEDIKECTLRPGEMIYVPPDWYHSTLNVGHTIAVAGGCQTNQTQMYYSSITEAGGFPAKRKCGMGPFLAGDEAKLTRTRQFLAEVPGHDLVHGLHGMYLVGKVQEAARKDKERLLASPAGRSATADMIAAHEYGFATRKAGREFQPLLLEAIQTAEQGAFINPRRPALFTVQAVAHLMLGNAGHGINAARRALELDAGDFTACRTLGLLLTKVNPPRFAESRSVLGACIFKASRDLEHVHDRECQRGLTLEIEELVDAIGIASRSIGRASASGLEDPTSAFDSVSRDLHTRLVSFRKKLGLPLLHTPTDEEKEAMKNH